MKRFGELAIIVCGLVALVAIDHDELAWGVVFVALAVMFYAVRRMEE